MNTKEQGSIGISAAISHYTKLYYPVFIPITDKQRYDLIVDKNGLLFRVEVKTSFQLAPSKKYVFELTTKGGNRSWNKQRVFLSSKECDLIFLHAENGDNWEFPISVLENRTTVTPDNLKYNIYKI